MVDFRMGSNLYGFIVVVINAAKIIKFALTTKSKQEKMTNHFIFSSQDGWKQIIANFCYGFLK